MKKSLFLSTTIIIVLLLIISVIIGFSLPRMNTGNIYNTNHRVAVLATDIVFNTSKTDKTIFSISPRDDFYYQNQTKDHMIDKKEFTTPRNSVEDFFLSLSNTLFSTQKLIWTVSGQNNYMAMVTKYEVSEKGEKTVEIKRTIQNSPTTGKIYAIGQALVYCKTCLLVDEHNNAYFQNGTFTSQKADIAAKLKLTPVLIGQSMPRNVFKKLSIIETTTGKKKATLNLSTEPEVFFDEQYHVLEIKTVIVGSQKSTSQTITFE